MTPPSNSHKNLQQAAENLVANGFLVLQTDDAATDADARQLANLWHALGSVPPPALSDMSAQVPISDTGDDQDQGYSIWRIPAWERWAASFVIFALLMGALVALQPWGAAADRPAETFLAKKAEVRDIRLTDGSSLKLSPQTAVEVALGNDKRRLRLVRGEALFSVAHDPARPFVVSVGENEVEAIGTVFSIRTAEAETEVSVVEGRIAVTIANGPGTQPTRRLLIAGERIRFGREIGSKVAVASATQTAPEPAIIEPAKDVTRNELSFEGERLGDVIAEMNRYGRDDIVLLEPALANIPVYGILHGGDVDGLMSIISEIAAEQGSTKNPVARINRQAR
jgi:transmembrane sensor